MKWLKLLGLLAVGLLIFASATPLFGDIASESVSATVTAKLVEVTVSPASFNYGILSVGATGTYGDVTIGRGASNVDVAIKLETSDAIGSTQNWTHTASGTPLDCTTGSAAYCHSYEINQGATPSWLYFPTSGTLTGTVTTLTASNPDDPMDLRIEMPTATTDYTAHTITITVQGEG